VKTGTLTTGILHHLLDIKIDLSCYSAYSIFCFNLRFVPLCSRYTCLSHCLNIILFCVAEQRATSTRLVVAKRSLKTCNGTNVSLYGRQSAVLQMFGLPTSDLAKMRVRVRIVQRGTTHITYLQPTSTNHLMRSNTISGGESCLNLHHCITNSVQ
jgi:hypothetical protein